MSLRRNGGVKLKVEPDPATWTALEEITFIELMVREVHNGNRSSTTFSRKGWKHIAQEFCKKTNKRYNYSQFRNKFNQLRTRYHDFSKLLKEPGFAWDPVLNTATATDGVWESYIKVNKNAKRFRKKGCTMFNELGIIFGDPVVTCKDAFPLAQYPSVSEDAFDLEDESTNATPSAYPSESSNGKGFPSKSSERRRQRSPSPASNIRVKREARTTVDGESLKEWAETTVPSGTSNKKWAEATKEEAPTFQRLDASTQPSAFSITNCVKCLESIEGVGASTYIKAIKMFKDVDWREMFMAMSAERRLDWLASLE
ncbi:L10-interacting MYB domain-containing protein-like [Cornus florida]|uniref:L10-interacting MYB domain-containing protein-like n=1 Tax=Cornus florida TaxID=4283 RepID=UPI0028988FD9|nr:L10-interacting MYB domain-containing protein-like [Cornus florida]XP_059649310.1 L10-interacting MYB domain-containing protein-like [Cornus florida]